MAEISSYGQDRLRPNELRVAKDLVKIVKNSKILSKKFKDNFSIDVCAKYQYPIILVPKTTDKELGKFEYDMLGIWAQINNIGWDWEEESSTYYVIGWECT